MHLQDKNPLTSEWVCVITQNLRFVAQASACKTQECVLSLALLRANLAARASLRFVRSSLEMHLQNKNPLTSEWVFILERITGLEPATSTLARWRSTK